MEKLTLILIISSLFYTLTYSQGQVINLSGIYQVLSLGPNLETKPEKPIQVIINQPQDITVRGCNTGTTKYFYNPITNQYNVKSFKEDGLRCVLHLDRQVMHYLELANKAIFNDDSLVFFHNDQKILALQLIESSQLNIQQPDQQPNFDLFLNNQTDIIKENSIEEGTGLQQIKDFQNNLKINS